MSLLASRAPDELKSRLVADVDAWVSH
jgi:hypothetical protein